MAKPQPRKPAAVAERRPAAASGSTKSAPVRRPPARPSAPATGPVRLPAQLGERTHGIQEWARAIITELRKVAWPTREYAMRLTAVVIAISVVVGLFLGGVDALFTLLMQWFLS